MKIFKRIRCQLTIKNLGQIEDKIDKEKKEIRNIYKQVFEKRTTKRLILAKETESAATSWRRYHFYTINERGFGIIKLGHDNPTGYPSRLVPCDDIIPHAPEMIKSLKEQKKDPIAKDLEDFYNLCKNMFPEDKEIKTDNSDITLKAHGIYKGYFNKLNLLSPADYKYTKKHINEITEYYKQRMATAQKNIKEINRILTELKDRYNTVLFINSVL